MLLHSVWIFCQSDILRTCCCSRCHPRGCRGSPKWQFCSSNSENLCCYWPHLILINNYHTAELLVKTERESNVSCLFPNRGRRGVLFFFSQSFCLQFSLSSSSVHFQAAVCRSKSSLAGLISTAWLWCYELSLKAAVLKCSFPPKLFF